MDLITQAKTFATQKHVSDNHQLYGILPYTHHLEAVENVLLNFNFNDPEIRAAAWLHDIVEDTAKKANRVKLRDIEELFGPEVAALVGAVTDEPGENRKVRKALTYPKIFNCGARAVALKLADRIANVENGSALHGMYRSEQAEFKRQLYSADHLLGAMWTELDGKLGL